MKPIGYSVYPNVVFTIEEGNSERHFDIQTQESTGNTGTSRNNAVNAFKKPTSCFTPPPPWYSNLSTHDRHRQGYGSEPRSVLAADNHLFGWKRVVCHSSLWLQKINIKSKRCVVEIPRPGVGGWGRVLCDVRATQQCTCLTWRETELYCSTVLQVCFAC